MTGFAATHTGSLTPSSNPWVFTGTITWHSDVDAALLPANEPVTLRLAFTTLSLTGATIAFTSSGSGRAATLPANGPFDGSTDYTVAAHKNRTVTYTITGSGPVGSRRGTQPRADDLQHPPGTRRRGTAIEMLIDGSLPGLPGIGDLSLGAADVWDENNFVYAGQPGEWLSMRFGSSVGDHTTGRVRMFGVQMPV